MTSCSGSINGGGITGATAEANTAEIEREQSVIYLLQCLLKEQRRTNAYLSVLTETTIEDPDIPV